MRATSKFPLVTGTLLVAALLASLSPTLARALVFDRGAIAAGQWWRLLTGNWVHFSAGHLLVDALALGVTGWKIERRHHASFALLCGVTAPAIELSVFFLAPGVGQYGGLSGLACAAVAWLAVDGLWEGRRAQQKLCAAALGTLAAKIVWECVTGRALFLAADDRLMVLPLAHAAGFIMGAGLALVQRLCARRHRWKRPDHLRALLAAEALDGGLGA